MDRNGTPGLQENQGKMKIEIKTSAQGKSESVTLGK